jgi:hypothetical protein
MKWDYWFLDVNPPCRILSSDLLSTLYALFFKTKKYSNIFYPRSCVCGSVAVRVVNSSPRSSRGSQGMRSVGEGSLGIQNGSTIGEALSVVVERENISSHLLTYPNTSHHWFDATQMIGPGSPQISTEVEKKNVYKILINDSWHAP